MKFEAWGLGCLGFTVYDARLEGVFWVSCGFAFGDVLRIFLFVVSSRGVCVREGKGGGEGGGRRTSRILAFMMCCQNAKICPCSRKHAAVKTPESFLIYMKRDNKRKHAAVKTPESFSIYMKKMDQETSIRPRLCSRGWRATQF